MFSRCLSAVFRWSSETVLVLLLAGTFATRTGGRQSRDNLSEAGIARAEQKLKTYEMTSGGAWLLPPGGSSKGWRSGSPCF